MLFCKRCNKLIFPGKKYCAHCQMVMRNADPLSTDYMQFGDFSEPAKSTDAFFTPQNEDVLFASPKRKRDARKRKIRSFISVTLVCGFLGFMGYQTVRLLKSVWPSAEKVQQRVQEYKDDKEQKKAVKNALEAIGKSLQEGGQNKDSSAEKENTEESGKSNIIFVSPKTGESSAKDPVKITEGSGEKTGTEAPDSAAKDTADAKNTGSGATDSGKDAQDAKKDTTGSGKTDSTETGKTGGSTGSGKTAASKDGSAGKDTQSAEAGSSAKKDPGSGSAAQNTPAGKTGTEKKDSGASFAGTGAQQGSFMPHADTRFYYNRLRSDLKRSYEELYAALMRFDARCSFTDTLTDTDISVLFTALRCDCPELMQLKESRNCSYVTNSSGKILYVEPEYGLSKQEYENRMARCTAVIDGLAAACKGKSEAEIEEYLYEYFTGNCFYDMTAKDAQTAYGVLVNGFAKCDGISHAMQWASEEAGVPCMMITGSHKNETIGHAWNGILLDGSWYMLDVTADVPRQGETKKGLHPAYNVPLSWMRRLYAIDTTLTEHFDLPQGGSMELSWHGVRGEFVHSDEAYMPHIESFAERLLEERSGVLCLQFEDSGKTQKVWEAFGKYMERIANEKYVGFSCNSASIDEHNVLRIRAEIK